MYGTFYASSKSTPPESDVSRYLASEEVFTHALGLLGFKVDKYMGTSGKTAYDTKVIYGYMMIQEYNSYVMAGVQRKIIFEAIINDAHLKQYEGVYPEGEDQDQYNREHFMKPVMGLPKDVYGIHYSKPDIEETNRSYQEIMSVECRSELMEAFKEYNDIITAAIISNVGSSHAELEPEILDAEEEGKEGNEEVSVTYLVELEPEIVTDDEDDVIEENNEIEWEDDFKQ
ncbi:hypothetical protein MRX96_031905 [Rhipicephalus microplus]